VQPPSQGDGVRADDRRALVVALEVECAGEPTEQPDAELGVFVAQRSGRLLQQLGRALVGDPRAPARVLVPDRGAGEQLTVAELPGDVRRRPERLQRIEGLARTVAGGTELQKHLRALVDALDPELQRGPQPRRGLVESERGGGRPRREDVVLDAASGSAERRGRGEVVGEIGERTARTALGAFKGLTDAQMELRPAHSGEPVVQGPANKLVRESVGQPTRRELLDHPAADGLVEDGE
jgi:hypothetical protein